MPLTPNLFFYDHHLIISTLKIGSTRQEFAPKLFFEQAKNLSHDWYLIHLRAYCPKKSLLSHYEHVHFILSLGPSYYWIPAPPLSSLEYVYVHWGAVFHHRINDTSERKRKEPLITIGMGGIRNTSMQISSSSNARWEIRLVRVPWCSHSYRS